MRLDLGCGNRPQDGFIGCDKFPLENVKVIWDLEKHPLPFESNSAEVIRVNHVLEHIHDLIGLMNEIHRILIPGGKLLIGVPLVGTMSDTGFIFGPGAFWDPSHVHFFVVDSFNYWQPNFVGNTDTGIRGCFKIISREVRQAPDDRFHYPSLNADFVLEKIP